MDRRNVISLALLAALPPGVSAAQAFSGNPAVELQPGGRTVKLLRDFSFKDSKGLEWLVPAGAIVDGASIPPALFSLTGGALDGPYRNASIIHDHYCVTRSRPWRAVHRVFYEGMVVGGVDNLKAKLMYFAVHKFGPRWEVKQVAVPTTRFSGPPTMELREVAVSLPAPEYNAADVKAALDLISSSDPSLDELDALANQGEAGG
jgi:hypothetical protein